MISETILVEATRVEAMAKVCHIISWVRLFVCCEGSWCTSEGFVGLPSAMPNVYI